MLMIQDSMCSGTSLTDVFQVKALFTSTITFILQRPERAELEVLGVILQFSTLLTHSYCTMHSLHKSNLTVDRE